jgi:hypothetical protein
MTKCEKLIELYEQKAIKDGSMDYAYLVVQYESLLRLAIESPKYFKEYTDELLLTGLAK